MGVHMRYAEWEPASEGPAGVDDLGGGWQIRWYRSRSGAGEAYHGLASRRDGDGPVIYIEVSERAEVAIERREEPAA